MELALVIFGLIAGATGENKTPTNTMGVVSKFTGLASSTPVCFPSLPRSQASLCWLAGKRPLVAFGLHQRPC